MSEAASLLSCGIPQVSGKPPSLRVTFPLAT